MTELQLRQDGPGTLGTAGTGGVRAASLPDGVAAIELWARTAQAAAGLVERLVGSPFIPETFWPKIDPRATLEQRAEARAVCVATATAAVLYGGEIGLSPMQALANVILIKGKPSLYAETMVALVQAAGHEIWTVEVTDHRAIVHGRRAGRQNIETGEMTMDRARKAGYVAANQKYHSDPQSMLYARAASIACRRTAPEVLKGIHIAEELWDENDGATPAAPRTAQRATRARPSTPALPAAGEPPPPPGQPVQAAAPPPLPGEDDYDPPTPPPPAAAPEPAAAEQEPRRITAAQSKALHATLGDLAVKNRDSGLALLSELTGRPLGSTKDLTVAEASTAIDTLGALAAAGDADPEIAQMIERGRALRATADGADGPPASTEVDGD